MVVDITKDDLSKINPFYILIVLFMIIVLMHLYAHHKVIEFKIKDITGLPVVNRIHPATQETILDSYKFETTEDDKMYRNIYNSDDVFKPKEVTFHFDPNKIIINDFTNPNINTITANVHTTDIDGDGNLVNYRGFNIKDTLYMTVPNCKNNLYPKRFANDGRHTLKNDKYHMLTVFGQSNGGVILLGYIDKTNTFYVTNKIVIMNNDYFNVFTITGNYNIMECVGCSEVVLW